MSSLRERIIEAIKRVDAQPSGETDPYEDMTDAVIAELNLTEDDGVIVGCTHD